MNLKILRASVVAAALIAATQALAVTVNFSYSSDLTDVNASNAVAGTITGRIVGLSDNATSSATALFIDSYPAAALGTIADPSYVTPVNVVPWNVEMNQFTLVNGIITAASFTSYQEGPGGFDQFFLNYDTIWGGTNYFAIGNNNRASIWNNLGLAGIDFDAGDSVPEPETWVLMISGFGLVGATARRRRIATA